MMLPCISSVAFLLCGWYIPAPRFTLTHLFGFICGLGCLLGVYRHGFERGKEQSVQEILKSHGVTITHYTWELRGKDGFFIAIDRFPEWAYDGHWSQNGGESYNPGQHCRTISWTDDEKGHMFHNALTYTPQPDYFLGDKKELPEVMWRRGLIKERPKKFPVETKALIPEK